MRSWRRFAGAAALGLALALSAGCGGGANEGQGSGVVKDVDLGARKVTLQHGDVPGLMKAMTMTFEVAPDVALDDVRPGARVDFTLVEQGGSYTITRMARAGS